jgi:hypothetical protein
MSIRAESRAKFEKQGVYLTRQNIQMENMHGRELQEALIWLAEDEHKTRDRESKRYWWMLGFTIVAAVSASIAAWPIVKEWLMR